MAAGVAKLWVLVSVCLQVHGSYPSEIVQMDTLCEDVYFIREPFTLRLTKKGENYSPNMTCEFRLQARPEYRIVLEIISVHIYSYSSCHDYLEIRDGIYSYSKSLTKKVCDKSHLDRILRTSNEKASILFSSDSKGEDAGFEIFVSQSSMESVSPESGNNAVFIGIAVTTSVLLLVVAVCMCICLYTSRKKEQLRRSRRRSRPNNTLQLRMTLELAGISNPVGPPPTPDVTAPAYSPPCAPPPYSTLPRRHAPIENADKETGENPQAGEVTQVQTENPPPYEEQL